MGSGLICVMANGGSLCEYVRTNYTIDIANLKYVARIRESGGQTKYSNSVVHQFNNTLHDARNIVYASFLTFRTCKHP